MSLSTLPLFSPLRSFLVFCSFLVVVFAQFQSVPASVAQCSAITLAWTATTAPYTLSVLDSTSSLPLERLLPSPSTSASWTADLPSPSTVLFQLQDGEGLVYNSTDILVTPGSGACMQQPQVIGGGGQRGEGEDTLLVNTGVGPATAVSLPASSLPTGLLSASIPLSSPSLPSSSSSSSIDPDAPPPTSSVFSGPVYSAVPGGYVPIGAEPSAAAQGGSYGSLQAASSSASRVSMDSLKVASLPVLLGGGLLFLV